MIPHIFRGASSSRRMGWLMNISRAFVQRNRISYSASWTCLPGRLPRTDVSCEWMRGYLLVIVLLLNQDRVQSVRPFRWCV
jgi:hypothetical protein